MDQCVQLFVGAAGSTLVRLPAPSDEAARLDLMKMLLATPQGRLGLFWAAYHVLREATQRSESSPFDWWVEAVLLTFDGSEGDLPTDFRDVMAAAGLLEAEQPIADPVYQLLLHHSNPEWESEQMRSWTARQGLESLG